MLTTIDSFDLTANIDPGGIQCTQALSDSASKLDLVVDDVGNRFTFDTGQEVILWDEQSSSAIPAHNLLTNTRFSSGWTSAGTISAGAMTVSGDGTTLTMTLANAVFGSRDYTQTSPVGHVHPGQSYCLSCYVTIASAPTNAGAYLIIDLLDNNGVIQSSGFNFTYTTTAGRQRLSVTATAYAFSTYVRARIGGQTISSSNSATFLFDTPQIEPMWFTGQGISYPTPDCNYYQADCYRMPDGTVSRARTFSGYIDAISASDDGPNRMWTLSVASASMLLDTGGQGGATGQINQTFSNTFDDDILTSLVATYFPTSISVNAGNSVSPSPLVTGVLIGSVSYSDNSLRDILNALTDQSGYVYYLDQYYRLNYTPAFYLEAGFTLSDNPDGVTSFPYHDYAYVKDATQRKRQVKIIGAKFLAPSITDTWNGNNTVLPYTKQFTLSFAPYDVKSIMVGSTPQRGGVWGVNNFGQGFDCLIDKANLHLIFNTAPTTGTGNVAMTYSYEAPVTAAVLDQDTAGVAVTPAYVVPSFIAKINDSTITDLPTATRRGLTEITKFGRPQVLPSLKTYNNYARPTSVVLLTCAADGLVSHPFVVQQVTYSNVGPGLDEYDYTLGDYNPQITLVDHIRHHNKALNKSTSTAGTTSVQQTDLGCREVVIYRDHITITEQNTYFTGIYGTSPYGSTAYAGGSSGGGGGGAGSTGVYGTATYGGSTVWG